MNTKEIIQKYLKENPDDFCIVDCVGNIQYAITEDVLIKMMGDAYNSGFEYGAWVS